MKPAGGIAVAVVGGVGAAVGVAVVGAAGKGSMQVGEPGRLSLEQAIRLAESELAVLKVWMSKDPKTPHARETGYRLSELAQILIDSGDTQ